MTHRYVLIVFSQDEAHHIDFDYLNEGLYSSVDVKSVDMYRFPGEPGPAGGAVCPAQAVFVMFAHPDFARVLLSVCRLYVMYCLPA